MEPEKLNHSAADDAAFDRWLRAEVRPRDLPDDGFARSVTQRLQAGARPSSSRARVCLVAAALGLGVAVVSLISTPTAAVDFGTFDSELQQAIRQAGAPGAGSAIGIALLSLAYVFRAELRRWRVRLVGI